MKKIKIAKRLVLTRQTIRQLDDHQLAQIVGGASDTCGPQNSGKSHTCPG